MEDIAGVVGLMAIGLLASTIMLVPVYLAHRRAEQLRATGKRVRGRVVSTKFFLGRPSGWLSTVRFTTQDGYVVQAAYKKDYARRTVGQVVWVSYDELNPDEFVI